MKNDVISILDDLVRINADRTSGYRKVVQELKPTDIDLRTMFTNMAEHSAQFSVELTSEIQKLGGEPSRDATQSGKIYRVWMDIRAAVNPNDRKSVISLCEHGEDAAMKAYCAALEGDQLPREVLEIVRDQYENIKAAHDVVKRYRDMHESVAR